MQSQGKLYVVGIGAGKGLLTLKALEAIEKSEYIVGYKRYVEEISDFIKHKKLVTTGMREEMKRVEIAVELAKNSVVSLVSGGDPSIYGILPFVYEYLMERNIDVDIEVIPGVSAVNAVSSLLGCPISGDHVVISLSDLLVPWNVIESRLVYALQGDFVIAIYNPSSSSRRRSRW
ncbi:MAG: precorrin-3B C(17)-methyltransferase [Archaeoglobaceae archaeon]